MGPGIVRARHVSGPRRRRVVRRVMLVITCGLVAAAAVLWWCLWPIAVPPADERRLVLECADSYLDAWQRGDTRLMDLLTSESSRDKGGPFLEYPGWEVRLTNIFWRPSKPLAEIIARTAMRPGKERRWKAPRIALPVYKIADQRYFLILVKEDRWLVLNGPECALLTDRHGQRPQPPPPPTSAGGR